MRRAFPISVAAFLMMATFGLTLHAETAVVGKAAPAFSLKGSDDQTHSLADYKGKTVVLYFHGVQCPWAKAYQPIINGLATKYAGVVFLGINSNHGESMDDVKGAVKEYSIAHAILKDPGNKVADAYGARTTPHIYVIDGEGKLRYVGGLEKAPVSPSDVGKSSEQYLAPVLDALAAGKEPPQTHTQSIGCSIKRERK